MSARARPEAQGAHDDVVAEVAKALRDSGWRLEKVVAVPTAQPDLLAWDPRGTPYVVEVKAGRGQGHLGAVAQVEAYRDALENELGRPVNAVLLLATDAPVQLDEVARNAHVLLLRADSRDSAALRSALAPMLRLAHHKDFE
jgi:hypothetical protein